MIIPNRIKLTITAPCGRKGCGKMNIGATILLAEAKVLIDVIENSV
jgi:hypothetical protein